MKTLLCHLTKKTWFSHIAIEVPGEETSNEWCEAVTDEEMIASGLVDKIRNEEGNERYEYFFPMEDSETVMLIDRWKNEEALDIHHKSEMMQEIAKLRKKYKLSMKIERFKDWENNKNDN